MLRRRFVLPLTRCAPKGVVLVLALAGAVGTLAGCKACGADAPAKVDAPPSAETMAQQKARLEINAENADDAATALAEQVAAELAAERAAAPAVDAGAAVAAPMVPVPVIVDGGVGKP